MRTSIKSVQNFAQELEIALGRHDGIFEPLHQLIFL
jgi:hypothetical protein